jgi:6-phosphogluconolactonase (cycloisomerase 2 family)
MRHACCSKQPTFREMKMTNRLFVQTNNPAGNQILVYERAEDGALTLAETVDTGGVGGRNGGAGSDPLTSQGSLVYDAHHGVLIAVNAGSDTVSVLGLDDYHLSPRQVLASGGTFPVSVTVHGDLLYVVNAHEAGAITGYRITDGQFQPIEDSTRSLQLTPVTGPEQFLNTPGQIGFTPDGQQLIITTKSNGSLIDVFTMHTDGRPSDTFVANPAGVPVPFGFTFDDYDHLVVTDAATSTLSTYTVHSDGHVKSIASQPDGGSAMCWVAHTAGNFYVADNGSRTVTGYHIDQAGTPTVFTQVKTRNGPIDLVGTQDGFLYVEVGTDGGVDGFRVKPDGTLAQIVTLTGLDGLEGIAVT